MYVRSSIPKIALSVFAVSGSLVLCCACNRVIAGAQSAKPAGRIMHFPEERAWFQDAGLQDALKYADYIRPNVGLSEKDLGMPMSKYRDLERSIAAAVFARDPKDVANDIKRTKYGMKNIGNGAPDKPANISWQAYMKSDLPELRAAMAEAANYMKTPYTINKDMGDYVLRYVDDALHEGRLSPSTPSYHLIRSSLFAHAVYYLFNSIKYKMSDDSLGPNNVEGAAGASEKGVFALDLPRGVCYDKSATFVHIINSETDKLGVSAGWTSCFARFGNWQSDIPRGLKTNHNDAVVTYQGFDIVEAYDVTNHVKLDCKDPNARALWAVTCTQFLEPLVKTPQLKINGKIVTYAYQDPICKLPKDEFMRLPEELSGKCLQASSAFRDFK